MRIFLHDLVPEVARVMMPEEGETVVIEESGPALFCTGCRACDYSHDGECVLKDGYHDMAEKLSTCDEFCIVSRLVYGGFSPFIKSVLDRSRGYFRNEGNRRSISKLRILFYESQILPREEETAREMVKELKTLFNAESLEIEFTEPVWEER